MLLAALCTAAYLIGSIPFGLILARRVAGVDIREHGSGNIGATNVWRILGPRLGLTCFILDVLKGLVPTVVAGYALGLIGDDHASAPELLAWMGVALCAILGHMFPVWLKFKGGKGVATGFGAMLGVFPVLTFAAMGALFVWLICARVLRMVGVSSCIAAVSLPLFVFGQRLASAHADDVLPHGAIAGGHPLWPYLAVAIPLALIVVYKHRGNLARTFAGKERKIGERESLGKPGNGRDTVRRTVS